MAMESPATYPESPMEQDDAAYPCKGCGEILEEGKAFELAGNRWHIDCFRCNTCGTLLDSDANLLLLGDGSLICNNCTYSCSSCGNKIEDLAILTGDQAFCASCFRCRNCKKKIENLRYARTSQGIFCMDCHESLMARRRKKTARNNAHRQQQKANGNVNIDKSLPSLPPSAVSALSAPSSSLSPEVETPPSETYSDTPTEIPSRYRPSDSRSEMSRSSRRDESPASQNKGNDSLMLPSSTYKSNRHSMMSNQSGLSGMDNNEEFLIPVAFDPTPPANQSPQVHGSKKDDRPRDYFGSAVTRSPYNSRKTSQDTKSPPSKDNSQVTSPASPHIAYQEKGRQPSETIESVRRRIDTPGSTTASATASPAAANSLRNQNVDSPKAVQVVKETQPAEEKFKLQDAPKRRKSSQSQLNSKSETTSPRVDTSVTILGATLERSPVQSQTKESTRSTPTETNKGSMGSVTLNSGSSSSPRASHDRNRDDSFDSTRSKPSPPAAPMGPLPKRGDSLDNTKAQIPRKEVGASSLKSSQFPGESTDENTSSSTPTQEASSPRPKANGVKTISQPIESPASKSIFDTSVPSGHGRSDSTKSVPKESFTAPRAPPLPPSLDLQRSRNESVSTAHSELSKVVEDQVSPTLPRYSAGGEFSLDEDMARILGSDDPTKDHESFLRRVSNSVRHGRSYSDKGTRLSKEAPRWPKSPGHASPLVGHDISSPITAAPDHRNELPWYKNEVIRQGKEIIERDQKIAELEAALNATVDIKQMNTELKEKRSTMVVLDAQKEIVVRELEILTDHIAETKTSGKPLDLNKMSNVVLREFAESLQKLKDSFSPQIEDLIQKRADLIEENSNLSNMKEKTLQEFEQLSLKNAQLAELNNQLVHQIQELYKANSGATQPAPGTPNGLGIYANHSKGSISVDHRETRPSLNDLSLPVSQGSVQQEEAEPVTVLQGPHVVNIRKGAQPKKFNWKKGGQNVAKGVTKGIKGAFSSVETKYQRDGQFTETQPYGSLTGGETPVSGASFPRSTTVEPSRQGFGGLFGNQKSSGNKSGPFRVMGQNGSSPQLVDSNPPATAASVLFGSDLEQRVEYEKTTIPGIVIRCIEEVELRGMDVEGIYRKSGGNSQIQMVKEGFERQPHDFDISDPDLDIHAVTSALKQYFRKLPTPLVTYEVYDDFLESNNFAINPAARIEALRRAVLNLPRAHRDVLEFLVFHLKRVVEREVENKMTSLNIAVVFAPTMMRPESLTREMTDTQAKNQAVQFMVENCHAVFMTE